MTCFVYHSLLTASLAMIYSTPFRQLHSLWEIIANSKCRSSALPSHCLIGDMQRSEPSSGILHIHYNFCDTIRSTKIEAAGGVTTFFQVGAILKCKEWYGLLLRWNNMQFTLRYRTGKDFPLTSLIVYVTEIRPSHELPKHKAVIRMMA